jgi:membrane protease subunit HflK
VVRVPVARVQTSESRAFWPAGGEALPERPGAPAPATLRPGRDGYAITADANLLHSQWALRYTIVNPERHVFRFCDAAPFLRNELERAVLLAVSRRRIDEALRTDIEALRAAVESQLRRRVEDLGLGIRVERVDALRLAPPRQVAAAFDSVIAAEQERSRLISAAGAEAARDLNEARGQAAGLEAEAQADRQRLVAEVKADADYFLKIREQYDANPGVTMRTLRQDALRRALAGVEEKYVVREPAGSRQEFRLLLGPEQAPPAAAP